MYFVYLLKSKNSGKTYTGHTNNLERRLLEHQNNLSKYTKGRGPWILVYSEKFNSRSEAMKREKFLKSGKGRELLKSLVSQSI